MDFLYFVLIDCRFASCIFATIIFFGKTLMFVPEVLLDKLNKQLYIQWNLSNSNTNFLKLPDFSKTTDGPDFFHYNLLQKYH